MPKLELEIACGTNPVVAVKRAAERLPIGAGEVWDLAVHHDADCPAIGKGPMRACTCEIVRLEAKRLR